jgi:aminoglycoside phosphotransferase (APT) family kinase protein
MNEALLLEQDSVVARLTRPDKNDVQRLLARTEHTLCGISSVDSVTPGVSNVVFFVDAVRQGDNPETKHAIRSMVLKLANPHPLLKRVRTEHEVAVMRFVQKHTRLPIPNVIDFCLNADESPLRCEFILMERMSGVSLADLCDHHRMISDSVRDAIAREYVQSLLELSRVEELSGVQWSFHGGMTLDPGTPGPILGNLPPFGPFPLYCDWVDAVLQWVIAQLPQSPLLHPSVTQCLASALQQYCREVLPALRQHEAGLPADDPWRRLRLCHCDLNPGNVMIDPETGHITGILDWEHAAVTFFDDDWLMAQTALSERLGFDPTTIAALRVELGLTEPEGCQARDKIRAVLYSSVGCCFLSATWVRRAADSAEERNDAMRRRAIAAAHGLIRALANCGIVVDQFR